MKRAAFVAVCWGSLSPRCERTGAQFHPRKKRVAVFDFDYATVHSGVAAIFGKDIDIGRV
jgi:hypothetical protein